MASKLLNLDPVLLLSIVGTVGTLAGALSTVLYNAWKVRREAKKDGYHSDELLHRSQRKMIESLAAQVTSLSNQVAESNTQLSYQRQYYESRIEEMRCGYQGMLDRLRDEINAMKRSCRENGVCFERLRNERNSQS